MWGPSLDRPVPCRRGPRQRCRESRTVVEVEGPPDARSKGWAWAGSPSKPPREETLRTPGSRTPSLQNPEAVVLSHRPGRASYLTLGTSGGAKS